MSVAELQQELVQARQQTDLLFERISPDSLYERPVAERHRLIFYRGHFDAFDWNILARRALGAKAFHESFDQLFERGIDPAPGEVRADSASDWPRCEEVGQYISNARSWIDSHLNDLDPAVLQMAIEHRQMHAETFAYLMHGLPYEQKIEKKIAGEAGQFVPRQAPRTSLVPVAAGVAVLGNTADEFGWDNERLAHNVAVEAFEMNQFKISNGEYLEYVNEGGAVPHFWVREGAAWFYRGMFAKAPLPLDQPVWVTWQQADAYAKWRGLALPSEAQFQIASAMTQPDPARDNFGFHHWDPVAVDAGHERANGHVLPQTPLQMIGNGWEWTGDVFAPFAGFEPHPLYPGYSSDFFDGEHYVMKGASPRTAGILTRSSFRNWFRPDYPHMYAGFRLVKN